MCNFPLRRGEGVLIYHQAFCDNKLLENSQNSKIYCTQKRWKKEYSFLRMKRLPTTRVLQTMGTHALYWVTLVEQQVPKINHPWVPLAGWLFQELLAPFESYPTQATPTKLIWSVSIIEVMVFLGSYGLSRQYALWT